MRTRAEINKSLRQVDNLNTRLWDFTSLVLEVLIDIRDALNEKKPNQSENSPAQIAAKSTTAAK